MSDSEILKGFRRGDSAIIQRYFYEYCHMAYYLYDQKYELSKKENLDFMSLAHQYALFLMEHDWKPLEDRSPNVKLSTWMVNGFRYVVLDALKWYKKEYGSITFEDYLCSFDVKDNLRLEFNKAIEELCCHHIDREERYIIEMLLISGFKTKEVAEQMGVTPSAITQKYNKIKQQIIIPYFKENFDLDFDMPEVIDEREMVLAEASFDMAQTPESTANAYIIKMSTMEKKRTTPEFITALQPREIFVFGSNLKGMHGGGAAYVAYKKFGAIMGQGVGLQGQSYGIPTMQGGVETIRPYVDEFIQFAKDHQELTFLVTRIGCGIAGFTDYEISPLFEKAHDVENIVLPEGW